jgi:prepilin-type N-terminal cleavage/methylation domain-containing protein
MKIPRTLKRFLDRGFTLIELLVVIGIIALLASIAVPAFSGVQVRAAQTKALSNAKQIGLACKQFAIDNNGLYPTYQYVASGNGTTLATTSNDAFTNLLPTYLTTISVFWLSKSGFCTPAQPSDPTQAAMASGQGLPDGSSLNEWAYVPDLYDTSTSTYPLIADGFAGTASSHAYTATQTAPGGVWKGAQAIVVFVDDSAKVMKTQPSNLEIPGGADGTDLFETSQSGSGWLGSNNQAINPG